MQRMNLDGVDLEYDVQGTGEPLVLIHGSILAADELEQRRGLTSERNEMRQRGLVRRDICLANSTEYATVENPRAYKQ